VLWMLREGQGTQFDPALLTLFFTVHEEIREISAQHPDVAEVVEALPAVRNPIAGDPAELSFAGQLTLS
jgi:HD-GYP domain-containing protein (c-di-GMP phosphodiesterase class II)